MRSRARNAVVTVLCLAGMMLISGGCAGMGIRRPSGPLVTSSVDGKRSLAPQFSTAVYMATDVAAAEIYLTDLPAARLVDGSDDLAGVSGSIVQMRLFIVPRAGNTPIGDTACNITMRHIVLSASPGGGPPEVGIYGGGGFLLPGSEPGDSTVSGTVSGVTLRMLALTPGFSDLLGSAEVSGGFVAKQDDKVARGLGVRVQRLLDRADKIADDQSTSIASPKE